MIESIAPAKAMQPPAPLLEERHHLRQRIQRLHAIARVIAAARMRPARVALLAAGAERDNFGLALRPAGALERDVEREKSLVEGGHLEPPLPTRHRTRDQPGEICFGAAKAVGIGSCDIDRDI